MVINVKYKIIVLALFTALVSACSDDTATPGTLNGTGEKTPIGVTALLDAGGSITRAADKDFDATSGDQLIAYLRHVKWDGTTGDRTQEHTAGFNKLVTFTAKGNGAYTGSDIKPIGLGGDVVVATKTDNVTNQAQTLEASPALYWDDFSANSSADGTSTSTNLRDAGHYLQSFYGYCYNGSPAYGENGTHFTAALAEATGVLGWNVATNQTSANKLDFKKSDLLWSAEQTPVAYAHVDGQGEKNHGTLILPYTHAMSKVTINVTLLESFAGGANFSGVTTTLHEMFSHCTCTAPTYTLTNKGNTTDITMWNGNTVDGKTTTCTFEAIVVPSILTSVNNLATIAGLDGNDYVIPITEAMLTGWSSQLTVTDEHINNGTAQAPAITRAAIERGKGYEMKSGVNYVLNVKISKQEVTVSATIKDWTNVEAKGVGLVQFTNDVTGKPGITDEYLKTHGIDVYKNSTNADFDTKTTILTWNTTYSKWEYNPVIYWAGQNDASYFRALSPTNTSTAMNQGTDILWGYACDDDANDGSKVGTNSEVAITPRTGDVPLYFEHPMSKITVKLETATGDYNDAECPAVYLNNAKIEISNLSKTGTLELVKGLIEPGTITAGTAIDGSVSAVTSNASVTSGTTTIANFPVIPQDISDDAIILKITLKDGPNGTDGTVYKLKLNTCVDSSSTADPKPAINEWERGKHYTYTINVEKEKITFRAMIKKWDESTGSGNATLEWD